MGAGYQGYINLIWGHMSMMTPLRCLDPAIDTTVKWLCMNLHFFHSLVSAMNIILGHYNLIILLELMV